ncbi:GTP-binding protein TypA/BipA [uncultured Gammaproteobacteria bacterium]|jgi:GTP-binding protein|uniref:translational GTPase TypA n=1 Tax=thiotrophic endosymbiont of Bathymodiolus puteoserpentis (Logatchev) TaxID=343240 RepID=UPI0010B92062|nr:translational GTPase TypA [thiotrophic endosymbiont of Bathymodiolus puteoserpentis (Logatchev)]CAC9577826.1 GTP-binding protein TypA/BipA [uncultured Gammaproteobacteria bacterium]CAC9628808.1 GTP-binding protein TypA/BipA [uncultured Gammaproteobacteria bacterium]CAC9956367.1 GTP-binding protein TypA/BipA [uncultured Gammaproteobacteria bacterium]CAC9997534.1 GTP-binding protein TypA/BipA [uncultured Gammaproteobacteria bacterium]SSC11368.1 GTP-binding protein TypA/BipA [thiotrophic endos
MNDKLRNIAIIAHVDHGKTTLVDKLLEQSQTFNERFESSDRMMDSNDLEKERGITISSKNTAIKWNDYHINIVDTPGHADFGGEVERVLSMVDSVLLLVDAQEGPMPQTRFVTKKAFDQGLNPIVVINKIDKDAARPDWVIDQVFDLFDQLGATDEQLDFPIIYASSINGYASLEDDVRSGDMTPMFETIVDKVAAPDVDVNAPLQMQITALDYSSFIGAIGIGRITRGTIKKNQQVMVVSADGAQRKAKIAGLMGFMGLEKIDTNSAEAGNIACVTGIEGISISDTICDVETVEALPPLSVDEPTVSMAFRVNDSPFAGQDGKYITSRNIRDRLDKELIYNVALRVENTQDPSEFLVSGRGELHLSILIETMRREGFELAVGRPQVILKEIDGVICEPFEDLSVDVESQHQGTVMEKLGERKGELTNMMPDGNGRVKLDFNIPARGLIGFRTEFLTATTGTGLMNSSFDAYKPRKEGEIGQRNNGSLISMTQGQAVAYAIFNLQKSGKFFVEHNTDIYEGMVVGIHSRDKDLVVNVMKGKQLTNVRASGTDEAVSLTPAIKLDLEQALEFIDDDELVEVTPNNTRIRKRLLTETERKRAR